MVVPLGTMIAPSGKGVGEGVGDGLGEGVGVGVGAAPDCNNQPEEQSVVLTTMAESVLLYNSTYSSSEPLPMIPEVGPRKRSSLISRSPGFGTTVRMKLTMKLPLNARFEPGPKLRPAGKKLKPDCVGVTV